MMSNSQGLSQAFRIKTLPHLYIGPTNGQASTLAFFFSHASFR